MEGLGERACGLVPDVRLNEEIWYGDSKEAKDWKGGVLLGDHPVLQRLLEADEESLCVHWLSVDHFIIVWKSVILDDTLE